MFSNSGKVTAVLLSLVLAPVLWFLLTPDILAFRTRFLAVKEAYSNNLSFYKTFRFVEHIEAIRGKYEFGKSMTEEQSKNRDNEIKVSLSEKDDVQELINYLKIYGKAMYFDLDRTGSYQVVFFQTLAKIHNNTNSHNLRQNIIRIKNELNLSDTDSGEFDSILETGKSKN